MSLPRDPWARRRIAQRRTFEVLATVGDPLYFSVLPQAPARLGTRRAWVVGPQESLPSVKTLGRSFWKTQPEDTESVGMLTEGAHYQ